MTMMTSQTTQTMHKSIDLGFSKQTSFSSVLRISLVRDLRIMMRYKANLIGGFLQIGVFMFIFSIFATAATFRGMDLTSSEIYTFYLSGMTLIFFGDAVLYSTVNTVNQELYNGTLEYVYSSPSSRYAYFLGGVVASFIKNLIFYIQMFIGLVLYQDISVVNLTSILLITLVFLIVLAPMGVMIAMGAIMWKQVAQITAMVNIVMQFMSGIFLPVSTLPTVAQYIAYLVPFTFALDLVRYYSFGGNWDLLMPKEYEFAFLLLHGVIYFFATRYLLGRVERYAKKQGLHLL
ncbi:MAG: hypothetical protein HeimC2_45960 [Candidatus Heimdallarchaeota archaeon LC_2]|nr:MAG: hypothetical protein HeimC2_45960 [Candidatus Heimdallarchaeota archaeon LC_2]